MEKPLVSILIPVKNGGEYLRAAITSALEQSYPNIEIIISNNHSTDFSAKIIKEFNNPKILKIKPPRSLTMTENWNYTLSHASGKYAVLLGADDILHQDFINERIVYHESNAEVFLSSSPHNIINENGEIIAIGDPNLRGLFTKEQMIPILLRGNPLNILTAFFRIDRTESGLNPAFPDHEYFPDWALWLEMTMAHNYVYFFDRICCDYRTHSASMTSSMGISKWALEVTKLITTFLMSHGKQLSALGFDPEDFQKKQTSKLWLAAQRAIRDGEWNVAWQLWIHYQHYHNILELSSDVFKELKHKIANSFTRPHNEHQ